MGLLVLVGQAQGAAPVEQQGGIAGLSAHLVQHGFAPWASRRIQRDAGLGDVGGRRHPPAHLRAGRR